MSRLNKNLILFEGTSLHLKMRFDGSRESLHPAALSTERHTGEIAVYHTVSFDKKLIREETR